MSRSSAEKAKSRLASRERNTGALGEVLQVPDLHFVCVVDKAAEIVLCEVNLLHQTGSSNFRDNALGLDTPDVDSAVGGCGEEDFLVATQANHRDFCLVFLGELRDF